MNMQACGLSILEDCPSGLDAGQLAGMARHAFTLPYDASLESMFIEFSVKDPPKADSSPVALYGAVYTACGLERDFEQEPGSKTPALNAARADTAVGATLCGYNFGLGLAMPAGTRVFVGAFAASEGGAEDEILVDVFGGLGFKVI
jgi:hypothetical protein